MRELKPWATRSRKREAWREFYAGYIKSPAWWRRRTQWLEEELELCGREQITCLGGCGRQWRLNRDDLHHCTYDRLGDEAHEDLWPMCRTCHDFLHQLMDSSKTWRLLPYLLANQRALSIVQDLRDPTEQRKSRVKSLREYL
ncbi:MAG: hypothetical protein ACK5LO_13680 [Leucobacter sp.]